MPPAIDYTAYPYAYLKQVDGGMGVLLTLTVAGRASFHLTSAARQGAVLACGIYASLYWGVGVRGVRDVGFREPALPSFPRFCFQQPVKS